MGLSLSQVLGNSVFDFLKVARDEGQQVDKII